MKIPTKWEDVVIKNYYRVIDISNAPDLTEIDKAGLLVAAITGTTIEQVEDMNIADFKNAVVQVNTIINTPLDKRVPHTFKCNGKVYEFNYIRPIAKAKHLMVLSQLTKDKKETVYNLHKILANFTTCLDDKQQSYEDRAKEFYEHLSIDVAYGISNFFLTSSSLLLQNIQTSLEKKLNKEMTSLKKELEKHTNKDGGGLFGWINFAKKREKLGTQ